MRLLNPNGTYENEWIILDKNDKAAIEDDDKSIVSYRLEYEIREEFHSTK